MEDLRRKVAESEDRIEELERELKKKNIDISTLEGGIIGPSLDITHCSVTKSFFFSASIPALSLNTTLVPLLNSRSFTENAILVFLPSSHHPLSMFKWSSLLAFWVMEVNIITQPP